VTDREKLLTAILSEIDSPEALGMSALAVIAMLEVRRAEQRRRQRRQLALTAAV